MSLTSYRAILDELDRLLSNGFEFLDQICQEVPAYSGEGKTVAKLLLEYYNFSPRKMLFVVLWATTREIDTTNREDVVFRESNVQTELMFGYFYTKRGLKYLNFLLNPLITTFTKYTLPVVGDYSSATYHNHVTTVTEQLTAFVERFINLDKVPLEFQRVFRHMKKEMNNKFTAPHSQFIVLSLLFLRVICPALVTPTHLKMEICITPPLQKVLVTCARVLQALANHVLMEDEVASVYNPFLTENFTRVREYFLRVTMEVPEGGVPEEKLQRKKSSAGAKEMALENIMRQLQGQTLDRVSLESRKARSSGEFKRLTEIINSAKWQVYKTRSDVNCDTYYLKLEGKAYATKMCGVVRASINKLFDFFCDYERSLAVIPSYVKSKVIKKHDDHHIDIQASHKLNFPSIGTKEYLFCKHDLLMCNVGVSFGWALKSEAKGDDDGKNDMRTIYPGFVFAPLEGKAGHSKLNIVVMSDRKGDGNVDSIDTLLLNVLHKIRQEVEV